MRQIQYLQHHKLHISDPQTAFSAASFSSRFTLTSSLCAVNTGNVTNVELLCIAASVLLLKAVALLTWTCFTVLLRIFLWNRFVLKIFKSTNDLIYIIKASFCPWNKRTKQFTMGGRGSGVQRSTSDWKTVGSVPASSCLLKCFWARHWTPHWSWWLKIGVSVRQWGHHQCVNVKRNNWSINCSENMLKSL